MSKFSMEVKLAAIKAKESGVGTLEVAKQYQMSVTLLKRLTRRYRLHGEKGLQSSTKNWTVEQKLEALKYMHENQLSITETGVVLGVDESVIRSWEKRYLENGISGVEDKRKTRKPRTPKPLQPKTRLEELEEENLNLRIENEYLKKLNALVAEREKGKK
jgi:transposase